MKTKALVDFKDLDKNFIVRIDEKTAKMLIGKLKKKYILWKIIAKKLNTSPANIHRIRKTGIINVDMLKIITKDLSIFFDNIRDNILTIRIWCRGIEIPNILPLYPSPELASIVGHALGDGGLNSKCCRFEYGNTRKELITAVKNDVTIVFKFDKPYETRLRKTENMKKIIYPSIIGRLLELTGTPRGKKVTKKYKIPDWIIKGNKEVKRSFLQAMFDDEGSVEKKTI